MFLHPVHKRHKLGRCLAGPYSDAAALSRHSKLQAVSWCSQRRCPCRQRAVADNRHIKSAAFAVSARQLTRRRVRRSFRREAFNSPLGATVHRVCDPRVALLGTTAFQSVSVPRMINGRQRWSDEGRIRLKTSQQFVIHGPTPAATYVTVRVM